MRKGCVRPFPNIFGEYGYNCSSASTVILYHVSHLLNRELHWELFVLGNISSPGFRLMMEFIQACCFQLFTLAGHSVYKAIKECLKCFRSDIHFSRVSTGLTACSLKYPVQHQGDPYKPVNSQWVRKVTFHFHFIIGMGHEALFGSSTNPVTTRCSRPSFFPLGNRGDMARG